MSLLQYLKKLKPAHWVNNILHYNALQHNEKAYKKYGVHKSLISSISSKDFPDKQSSAWLDVQNSRDCVQSHKGFDRFSPELQEQLRSWSDNGYLTISGHFNEAEMNEVNASVDDLIHQKGFSVTHDNKLMFGYKHSKAIRRMMNDQPLIYLLSFILDREVVPFQTLNFI